MVEKITAFFENINFSFRKAEPKITASWMNPTYSPIAVVSYDGEKTLGEIGVIKKYKIDNVRLRERAWQSFIENDLTQNILKKYVLWSIGSGLKLQAEPMDSILKDNGINLDKENFCRHVEDRFLMYSKDRKFDYAEEITFFEFQRQAKLNALLAGDVLVIKRIENGKLNVQLVDGRHVVSPSPFHKLQNDAKNRGNKIVDGVEIDKKRKHVAYYVCDENNKINRILAKDKRGNKISYLFYGLKLFINDVRGISILSAILETSKMLDRYKQATVASAEERQKISYAIEHNEISTGQNPLTKQIANSFSKDGGLDMESLLNRTQQNIAQTSQKSVFNMPNGATLKQLVSDNEISFEAFYKPNLDLICACIGIPPDIAMSKYDSNFSASRAAIKDWEHTLLVDRKNTGIELIKPIYDTWLDLQVLQNKIQAPKYIESILTDNIEILEAYRNSRWQGASVPHIDPLKEVMAERAKLGDLASHAPLTTIERATENVNGGESYSNIEQFIKELEMLPKPEIPKENTVNRNKTE